MFNCPFSFKVARFELLSDVNVKPRIGDARKSINKISFYGLMYLIC